MRVLIVSEGKHELEGALQALVERLAAGKDLECESERISRNDIHAFHGIGQGFKKRALRWLFEARKRGCEALVLVIDQDGHPERTAQIHEAQRYEKAGIRQALGVAIRSFDTWMLADERALTDVLGYQVQRQSEPERIADPKVKCAALRCASPNGMSQTEMYVAVARAAHLDTLEERCPNGFRPFAQRVKAL